MDGGMVIGMEGWIEGTMEGWMVRGMEGWVEGGVVEWMEGWRRSCLLQLPANISLRTEKWRDEGGLWGVGG